MCSLKYDDVIDAIKEDNSDFIDCNSFDIINNCELDSLEQWELENFICIATQYNSVNALSSLIYLFESLYFDYDDYTKNRNLNFIIKTGINIAKDKNNKEVLHYLKSINIYEHE